MVNHSDQDKKDDCKTTKKRKIKGINVHKTYTAEKARKRLGLSKDRFLMLRRYGLIPLGTRAGYSYLGQDVVDALKNMSIEEMGYGEKEERKR